MARFFLSKLVFIEISRLAIAKNNYLALCKAHAQM